MLEIMHLTHHIMLAGFPDFLELGVLFCSKWQSGMYFFRYASQLETLFKTDLYFAQMPDSLNSTKPN